MSKRDAAIDIAKAIGILLMILGHCNGLPHLVRNFIFSFHMPLFFILSGYFYKPKNLKDVVIGGNKHLVKPYLITSFFCIFLCLTACDLNLAEAKIIGMIMSNGGWANEMFGATLPYIGPIWFFLALYWCKIFYAYLRQRTEKCLFFSFVISTIALVIGKYIVNLPLGILTGFCGMVFYSMGDYWNRKMKEPIKTPYLIISLIVWALCIWKAHLELASFDCNLYPISMFAAFIGTYFTYLVSKKFPSFLHPIFIWIGQNTLLILCYHTLSFFIMLNIKHYYFEPNKIILHGITNSIISYTLSLGLPYLHTIIWKQFAKRRVCQHFDTPSCEKM